MNLSERRICNFFRKYGNCCLVNKFSLDLDYSDTETLNMDVKRSNNSIIINYIYRKSTDYIDIPLVPLCLSNYINSFLGDYIKLGVKIRFPLDYPFNQPVWSLYSVHHNLVCQLDIKNYYQYQIDNHNMMYKRVWSPAIDIDKDILEFTQKNNFFRDISIYI